jgi:hypothetical protein
LSEGEQSSGFWRTLPGILSAVAAFVTALTGLIVGLNAVGILGDNQDSARQDSAAGVGRPRPHPLTADAVAGPWSGKVRQGRSNVYELQLYIRKGCTVKETCGSVSVSHVPCFGDLSLKEISGDRYEFSVDHFSAASAATCTPGAGEYLTPRGDDSLVYTTGYDRSVRGILHPPR